MSRKHLVLIIWLAAVPITGLEAQIGLPAQSLFDSETPTEPNLTLGAQTNTTPHVQDLKILRERERALIERKPDLESWDGRRQNLVTERKALEKGLKRVRGRVFQIPDKTEPNTEINYPSVDSRLKHPGEIEQLEQLILVIQTAESVLAELRGQFLEEERMLRAAIDDASTLDTRREDKARQTPAQKERYGIRDVERIARGMRTADQKLAQVRALEEQAQFEVDRTRDAVNLQLAELPDLLPVESAVETENKWLKRTLGSAEKTLNRNKQLRARLSSWIDLLRLDAKALIETRARYYRIQGYLAEEALRAQEVKLALALEEVRVSPEEQEDLQARYERSKRLRSQKLSQLREDASILQSSQLGGAADPDDPFDPARIRDLRLMAIGEGRNLEQAKLKRDIFRRDIAQVLNGILGGQSPGDDFLERYQEVLKPGYLDARLKQLRHRCEAWRRERGNVRESARGMENVQARTRLLNAYAQIEDICDRQQRVWSHRNFLAEFTQHHIDRLERSQRGLLWFLPRLLFSFLFALIAFFITRLLGHYTRKAATDQLAKLANQTLLGPVLTKRFSPRLYRNLAVLIYFGGAMAIWTSAALLCTGLVWGVDFDLQRIGEWATHPLLSLSGSSVSLWTIIRLILLVTGAIWFARFMQRFMADHLLQYFEMDRGVRDAFSTLIRYIVLVVGLSFGLASVGIGSGALAVLFGVIGIGIGFGLQNITSNFVSGLIILFERPIRKGDYIEAGTLFGEVTEINARATTIETRDAISVIVPNSEFINGRVVNWTHGTSQSIRAQIKIGVAYGSDVDKVEEVLLEVARNNTDVLNRPAPNVLLVSFADSAMIFELNFWSRRVFTMPNMISDLNKRVITVFKEEGITIPFPQRDVHIHQTEKT